MIALRKAAERVGARLDALDSRPDAERLRRHLENTPGRLAWYEVIALAVLGIAVSAAVESARWWLAVGW